MRTILPMTSREGLVIIHTHCSPDYGGPLHPGIAAIYSGTPRRDDGPADESPPTQTEPYLEYSEEPYVLTLSEGELSDLCLILHPRPL